jgi:uncharacterized protein HemX
MNFEPVKHSQEPLETKEPSTTSRSTQERSNDNTIEIVLGSIAIVAAIIAAIGLLILGKPRL